MATTTASSTAVPAQWSQKSGPAPGVGGLAGQMRLMVCDDPVGLLKVADGDVAIGPDGEAPATLIAEDQPTLVQLLGGDLQPIVARLQGRARVDGDVRFALRVLLGLQAGSPWTGVIPRSRPS